jgi:hypothetical protein
MEDKLEIIISVEGKPEPYEIKFEDLYAVRDKIKSIMFLWNANSVYADCVSNTFIIHGGRRIKFPEMGQTKIEYRKRTSMQVSASGAHDQKRSHVWLIGLRSIDTDTVLIVEVDKTGALWEWRNVI